MASSLYTQFGFCHRRIDVSVVKRGQNLEAEGEAEDNFWRLRPRPRPKINYDKSAK